METASGGGMEEGSFPDSSDNLETHQKKTLFKQAEMWLRTDAIHHKVTEVLHRVTELLGDWKTKMAHWSDEHPPPDPERGRDRDFTSVAEAIARAAAREYARNVQVEIGSYNEGGNGSSQQWRNWVMTMLGTLIVIGVTSLVVMYANQKAMESRMDSVERRLSNVEHKLWP